MIKQIDLQLSQLQLSSQASRDLNYSYSVLSGLTNSQKRSRNNSQSRQPRFSRKKSKQSVDKFRNRIKSADKVNSSLCSTNKQQCKESMFSKKAEHCEHEQREKIKKNFNNIYNLQHRNKQIMIKNSLKEENEKIKEGREKENKKVRQKSSEGRQDGIKYLPMWDVLNYKNKPIKNNKLIERRLFNKIQVNASYY